MIKHWPFSFLIVIFILLSTLLTSCSDRLNNTDYVFSTGHKLSEDEIASLKEKLTEGNETSDRPAFNITENTIYYWTDGGKKLHLFSECQSLSRADTSTIKKGTLADAFHQNKTEPCAFCLENAGLVADDFPVFVPSSDETSTQAVSTQDSVPDDNIIYIWTKSGSKLHIFENCTYLSRTSEENRIRGTKEDAFSAGFSEICSSCQKRAQSTD